MMARQSLDGLPRTAAAFLLGAVLWGGVGCTVQRSTLLSHGTASAGAGESGAAGSGGTAGVGAQAGTGAAQLAIAGSGPVTPTVVRVIDERPIGGASLSGGTTGGGTYAEALAKGQLYYVDTAQGIRDLISSNTPAVLLIAEGTYNFPSEGQTVKVCDQACNPATPVAQQVVDASGCASGATLYDVSDPRVFLRFGDNKTLIGLGKGAIFENAMISLSNVTNIILRNLVLEDVAGNISGLGYGINLWPGDHVWVDHCTFRNIGRSYFNISSTLDDASGQTLVETGYITITNSYFDGRVPAVCGQRSPSVLGANQVSALTFANNWIHRSSRYNVYLFGPHGWAHLFNNVWSDISTQGLGAACGATVLAQGNVFESATSALYCGNNGLGVYDFCNATPYGRFYAPLTLGTDETNVIDGASTLSLNSQPTDGTGITKPVRRSGHTFTITTPTGGGVTTESYEATLMADPTTVATLVKAAAGAGTLF